MATVGSALEAGTQALRQGAYVIDLTQVTHADSAAIALILQWLREAAALGAQLQIRGAPRALQDLAKLYSVNPFIPFSPADVPGPA